MSGSCVRSTRPGADQCVDRAADRRRAAADALGDVVERCRFASAIAPSNWRRARSVRSAGPSATQWCATAGEPRRERFRCRSPDHACSLANVFVSATLLVATPACVRATRPAAMEAARSHDSRPAPSAQRLGPGLRQPVHGPVERDLSRAAAGVHHDRARPAGDGARRDRWSGRGDREFRQAFLRAAVGPQPQAQAMGDGRLRNCRAVEAAVPARGKRARR